MDAAGGASEAEVVRCLRILREGRGLKPGTQNGPRHWSWFPTVVGDYFRQKREREEAAAPTTFEDWEERNTSREKREEFERMTEQ